MRLARHVGHAQRWTFHAHSIDPAGDVDLQTAMLKLSSAVVLKPKVQARQVFLETLRHPLQRTPHKH